MPRTDATVRSTFYIPIMWAGPLAGIALWWAGEAPCVPLGRRAADMYDG